jgi:DNA-binding transcriptional regulator YiaG
MKMVIGDTWHWANEHQKKIMEEELTSKNCGKKLKIIKDVSGITTKEFAKILGVREWTLYRLEKSVTKPTQDFLNRLHALQVIGFEKFRSLSDSEKGSIAERIGTGAGIGAGVGASIMAISGAGTVSGLSAAGITSGLAALGGTMLGGIAVVACIPVAAGFIGYGVAQGIKKICEANDLTCKEVDGRWEIARNTSRQITINSAGG